MSENGIRLNYIKAEGDFRTPEHRKGLETAIETYSISNDSFKNNKDDVVEGAVRLLSGYDVDSSFSTEPERNLFALAISDAWLSTDSIKEKKSLLDILKLVATGEDKDQNYGTLSGKVKILSQHGIPRGAMFDPDAEENSHSKYVTMLLKYSEDNADSDLTEEVAEIMSDWGENAKLQQVRAKLGLNSKEDERPFKVIVLDKTAQEMFDDVGYTSFYVSKPDGLIIVFNRDYQKSDSIEHEYAHSQGVGVDEWYQHLLFRGVNEALTEGSTKVPQSYPIQREFMNKIFAVHPEYENLLYKAYVGDMEARKVIFSKMVNDYGMRGFLTFARVAPIDNPKMSGYIGESIYIEPNRALKMLKRV